MGGVTGFLVGGTSGGAAGGITCIETGPGALACGAAGAITGQLLGTIAGAMGGAIGGATFIPCPATQTETLGRTEGAVGAGALTMAEHGSTKKGSKKRLRPDHEKGQARKRREQTRPRNPKWRPEKKPRKPKRILGSPRKNKYPKSDANPSIEPAVIPE